MYQHGGAGFRETVPFVLAYVELEGTGGVKMLTNIIDCGRILYGLVFLLK
jgi:uncharacterized OB-fold protein